MSGIFEIHATVRDQDAEVIAAHLAESFALIAASTGTELDDLPTIPVHIFRTAWEIRDFLDRHTPIDVAPMDQFAGICWFDGDCPAIATSLEDRPLSSVFEILQHELYHCFEYLKFGGPMDPWLSEGHAQSFEDLILADGTWIAGRVNAGRIERLRYARSKKVSMPPQILLMTTQDHVDGWNRLDPGQLARFYDHCWAMVHFLNNECSSDWSLIDFVKQSESAEPMQALAAGLGGQVSIPEFLEKFDRWVDTVEPDPLSAAIDRLDLISSWMLWISRERSLDGMQSVEKLRQLASFYQVGDITIGREAPHLSENRPYTYERGDGSEPVTFEMLPEESAELLPRLRATGMAQLNGGNLTLAWYPGRLGPIPEFRYEAGTGN